MGIISTWVSRDPRAVVTVKSFSDGTIKCDTCSDAFWCDHVQQVIREGRDGPDLWMNYRTDPNWNIISLPFRVADKIPISVELSPVSSAVDYALNVRLYAVGDDLPSSYLRHKPFIGHLADTEGRLVILLMVLDWFEPEVDKPQGECRGVGHTPSREMAVARATKVWDLLITNQWTLKFFNVCVPCYKDRYRANRLGSRFDPDLIPTT